MNKRILIAGGAGFLGTHLCEYLLKKDHHVICLDNFTTGSLTNIEYALEHPRFTLIKHDVTRPISLQIDEIYNLACPASPAAYQKSPIETTKTNVLGSINLLNLATENNARILQASTSEVYGDPEQHPQNENYWGNVNPTGKRACYDEGKRCAESLFFDYNRQYGVDIRVARIFNTYGPKMQFDDGRVVSNFILQAINGQELSIYGDGSQTRSFCYVDDTINAIVRLMESDIAPVEPVNIGNPKELTILELANLIVELTQSRSRISFRRLPENDPTRRMPDIDKIFQLTGWRPTIELRDGLKKSILYFKFHETSRTENRTMNKSASYDY